MEQTQDVSPPGGDPALRLAGLRKSFNGGRTFAVDGVDLEVDAGELVVLLGESGCGKTTTLKMINRLIEPTAGSVEMEGRDTAARDPVELRRHIGYVFQGVGLFPHMTVGENVAAVPSLLGWSEDETRQRVDELLELIGLQPDDFRDRRPDQLSGGQQQRVGLARALAARPRTMLMDEPFGALDPLTREDLQREFRGIHDELGLSTVMVTHDMTEALLLGDRIAVMRDGFIDCIGTPREMITESGSEYVRKLMAMPRRQVEHIEKLIREAGGS